MHAKVGFIFISWGEEAEVRQQLTCDRIQVLLLHLDAEADAAEQGVHRVCVPRRRVRAERVRAGAALHCSSSGGRGSGQVWQQARDRAQELRARLARTRAPSPSPQSSQFRPSART